MLFMVENQEDLDIVNYLLEKGEIRLPTTYFDDKVIIEIGKELNKTAMASAALRLSKLYAKVGKNAGTYFNLPAFENMLKEIHAKAIEFEKEQKQLLTTYDLEIIKFFVINSKLPLEDLMEIIGPITYLAELTDSLEKNKDKIPDEIMMAVYCWLFAGLYETILHQMDRRLITYLKHNPPKTKNINEFINRVDRKGGNHAEAGKIYYALTEIIKAQDTTCILDNKSEPKLIRNKISHLNLFYDKRTQKIILLGGKQYTKQEFLKQYKQIFMFLFQWIKESTPTNPNGEKFKEELEKEISNLFTNISKSLKKINRAPELRTKLTNVIIDWKQDIAKSKQTKSTS